MYESFSYNSKIKISTIINIELKHFVIYVFARIYAPCGSLIFIIMSDPWNECSETTRTIYYIGIARGLYA